MANNVTELSTTASSNSAYNGISILGTAPVSNFDDALRDLGAMIRSGMDTGNIMGSAYLTKSAGYTALTTDRGKTINCTAALTLALTAAATLGSGWICFVKANGGDVTIDPNALETINGAATYVVYDGNSATVICDGTNFQVVHHGPIVTKWVAYTPTVTGFGTAVGPSFRSRRVGRNLEILGRFTSGTSTATEARISLGFNGTNGGFAVDSFMNSAIWRVVGDFATDSAFAASFSVLATGGQEYLKLGTQSAGRASLTPATGTAMATSGDTVGISASIPIEGWS